MKSIKACVILFFLKGIALLPLWILYIFSNAIYFVLYYILKYRRDVVRTNLQNAIGDNSRYDLKQIEKEFYYQLSDNIVEAIKLLHISDKELNHRITVIGGELMEQMAKDGKSVIVMLGHYGNWEWVSKAVWHFKKPQKHLLIYRHAKNKAFNEVLKVIRSRFDFEQILQKKALRTILKHHTCGEQFMCAFIADQRPNSSNMHHWTTFLGQDTPYVVGGEEVGRHIGAHFIYVDVDKPRRGHYYIRLKEIKPVEGERYPYTIAYLRMMEETIRRAPAYWLWSHKRWSIKRQ